MRGYKQELLLFDEQTSSSWITSITINNYTEPYMNAFSRSSFFVGALAWSLSIFAASTSFAAHAGAIEQTLHSFSSAEGMNGLGFYPNEDLLYWPDAAPAGVYAKDGNFYGVTSPVPNGYGGRIYRIVPATGLITFIHSFSYTDGSLPNGLMLGSDGNLYGTTYDGGSAGYGTVFRITTAGVLTTLHSFGAAASDGRYPGSGLIQASDGNFYGATLQGGSNSTCPSIGGYLHGCGTIFRITPSGVESVLYSFGSNGIFPTGVMQASDGNLYGTTSDSGSTDSGDGSLFKISLAGTFTTIHTFTGVDGQGPASPPVQGADGYLYGTTTGGGTLSKGNIYKFSTAGVGGNLYSFTGGVDGWAPFSGLILGPVSGTFFGLTVGGGTAGNGEMFEVTSAGVLTPEYSFTGGNDGSQPYSTLVPVKQTGVSRTYNFDATTTEGGVNQWGTLVQIGVYN